MRSEHKRILPIRDYTIGHWRFRDNLNDLTGLGNDLIHNAGVLTYVDGVTEIGARAAQLDGTANSMVIEPPDDTDFAMGLDSFTGECIFQTTKSGYMALLEHSSAGTSENPTGWVFVVTSGKPAIVFGDGDIGSWDVSEQASESVNDGKVHHLAWVVDRANALAHIYIDGVESVDSPWAIPGGMGSLTPGANLYFWVGDQFQGTMHEACVIKEALTAAAIAERSAGYYVPVSSYSKGFLQRFLPSVHHENEALAEFLIAPETEYPLIRLDAADLIALRSPERCPSAWLSALAGNLGFELIGIEYATDTERRHLLQNIIWIYRRKGMVASIEKIAELLGYTPTITEVFSTDFPFILNLHTTYDTGAARTAVFDDDFSSGNLTAYTPLNLGSWWRLDGGDLKGTGDGTNSSLNTVVFDDAEDAYLYEAQLQIPTADFVVGLEFGLYLRWQDSSNWLRLEVRKTATDVRLVLVKNVSDSPTTTVLAIDTATLNAFDGQFERLWIYDDGNDNYTTGSGNVTLAYSVNFDASAIGRTKKGLWINETATMFVSAVTVHSVDNNLTPQLFTAGFLDRKLQISLAGTPQFNLNKKEYLKRVLPRYVPAGVTIEWL